MKANDQTLYTNSMKQMPKKAKWSDPVFKQYEAETMKAKHFDPKYKQHEAKSLKAK